MRKLLLSALLAATAASAQTPPRSPQSDWTHVQVLPMGTKVHIKTLDHGSIRCIVASVTADSILCGGVTFQRSSILYIKGSHKLRSTLIGIGVGYGTAFGVSLAYAEGCKNSCKFGTSAAVGLVDLGLLVATPIVFGINDLTAGTIYKAP